MHMKRTCGPDSGPISGCAQIQAGQQTLTRLVFEQRGGTETSSLRISPRVTASRCSAISSWCQLILTGAGSNCGHARAKNSISEFSQRSRSLRRSSADKSAGSLFRDAAGDKLVNKVLLHFLAVQAIELARSALLGAVDEHAELATDIDQRPLLVVQLELDAPDIARVLAAPVLEILDNDLLHCGQMIQARVR